MNRISKPGIYPDIPAEQYHGQLTDGPSLGRSTAFDLIFSCPAKAWWNCHLNPEYVPARKKEFDLGTAAHLIMLEPEQWGDRVELIDADDFRTKAAQEARDRAYAAGRTPLLPKHVDQIQGMHAALLRHPLAAKAFVGGKAEPTIVAKDPETGIWLKARPDYLTAVSRGTLMFDYKTTTDANPHEWAKRLFDMGHFVQDPWYRMVHELATGETVQDFIFIVQEVAPPHLISVNRLDMPDFEMGHRVNRRAIDLFAECMATNKWPAYGDGVNSISLPTFARYRLADMEGAGQLTSPPPSAALLEFARKMQAPLQLEHQS